MERAPSGVDWLAVNLEHSRYGTSPASERPVWAKKDRAGRARSEMENAQSGASGYFCSPGFLSRSSGEMSSKERSQCLM